VVVGFLGSRFGFVGVGEGGDVGHERPGWLGITGMPRLLKNCPYRSGIERSIAAKKRTPSPTSENRGGPLEPHSLTRPPPNGPRADDTTNTFSADPSVSRRYRAAAWRVRGGLRKLGYPPISPLSCASRLAPFEDFIPGGCRGPSSSRSMIWSGESVTFRVRRSGAWLSHIGLLPDVVHSWRYANATWLTESHKTIVRRGNVYRHISTRHSLVPVPSGQ
jgi:hypothetical protein